MLICGRGLCQVEIAQVWCQKQVYLEPRPEAKDTWPRRVLRVELATIGGEGASWPPESIVHLRDRHILCGRACKLPTQETPLCFGAKEAEAIFLSYLLQPPGWISRRRWSDRFTPHLLGTSSHLVSSASIVHSVYLTFSQSLGTPVSIYFSDLQTGFQFRLSWGYGWEGWGVGFYTCHWRGALSAALPDPRVLFWAGSQASDHPLPHQVVILSNFWAGGFPRTQGPF